MASPRTGQPPTADVVVIGAGAAGMATALALDGLDVVVVAARPPGTGGSTPLARGGVAAAVGDDDSAREHAHDTEVAGAGWCRPEVVDLITRSGPGAIAWLETTGVAFDRGADGRVHLGLEGGHHHRRILHAGGDRTGAVLAGGLAAALAAHPRVEVRTGEAVELLVDGRGAVTGVVVDDGTGLGCLRARATVLASGGLGAAFAQTTNPRDVRGDGLAMALRAGAAVADLELIQFHPTALAVPGDPLPLLTEALRGEGAVLLDADGAPLMAGRHPLGDLAPRDIVARRVHQARMAGGAWLDVRAMAAEGVLAARFPGVVAACGRAGLDPAVDLLPVTPAAHYTMGGVVTDDRGATSLRGLWAVGEVARTGLHGANRLASNSLLEAVVVGRRAGSAISGELHEAGRATPLEGAPAAPPRALDADDAEVVADVRAVLADRLGPVRDPGGLAHAGSRLARHRAARHGRRAADALAVAEAVVRAAQARPTSLGAHFIAPVGTP